MVRKIGLMTVLAAAASLAWSVGAQSLPLGWTADGGSRVHAGTGLICPSVDGIEIISVATDGPASGCNYGFPCMKAGDCRGSMLGMTVLAGGSEALMLEGYNQAIGRTAFKPLTNGPALSGPPLHFAGQSQGPVSAFMGMWSMSGVKGPVYLMGLYTDGALSAAQRLATAVAAANRPPGSSPPTQ